MALDIARTVQQGVGFGAAPIGNAKPPLSPEAGLAILDAAYDAGMRYFDTAPLYGRGTSEKLLGDFIEMRRPKDIVVSSKVGRLLDGNGFVYDYSFDGIMRSIETSLSRLKTDHIGIVFFHDIGRTTHGDHHKFIRDIALGEGYKALARLQQEKVISRIGIGVNEVPACLDAMERVHLDYILLAGRYTLLDQSASEELMPAIRASTTRLIVGGVFNSGILASGLVAGALHNYRPAMPDIVERVRKLTFMCEEYCVELGAAAVQFARSNLAVDSILCGVSSGQELRDLIRWSKAKIPQEFWNTLRKKHLIRRLPTDTI